MEKITREIIYLYDEDIQQCTVKRIQNKKISHYDLDIDDVIDDNIKNIIYNDEAIVIYIDKVLNFRKIIIV